MKRYTIPSILPQASKIVDEFSLCDACLGRLYAKKLQVISTILLGKKIRKRLDKNQSDKCYICKNLCIHLGPYLDRLCELIDGMEFSSFVIGAILKPSVLDRDDQIRSRFCMRGTDGIKTDITKTFAKKFRKITKAKIDHLNPDLTITINFKNDSFDIHARPIILYGRYVKKTRDLLQKHTRHKTRHTNDAIIPTSDSSFSIERYITEFCHDMFGSNTIKITWIGGEDKQSLVLGKGRPFFAQVLYPKKRNVKFKRKTYKFNHNNHNLELHSLKLVSNIPKSPILFKSIIEIYIKTTDVITSSQLKNSLKKTLLSTSIKIYEDNQKINQKYIYSIKYKKTSPTTFNMIIKADGGLPIKRFIQSDNVNPNISDILDTKCVCERFDFHDIIYD